MKSTCCVLKTSHASECAPTHVMLDCELEDLFERIYRVLSTYGISLKVSNVIISCKEDLDGVIRIYMLLEVAGGAGKERIHSFRIDGSGTPSRSSSLRSLIES